MEISLFPNPSEGEFNIDLAETELTWMSIRVIDFSRKIFLDKETTKEISDRVYKLNLNIPAGIYLLQIMDLKANSRYIQRIAVSKN